MSKQRWMKYGHLDRCPLCENDGHPNQDQEESGDGTLLELWPMHRLNGEHTYDEAWLEIWADKAKDRIAVAILDELHPWTDDGTSFHERTWRLAEMVDQAMFPSDGSKIGADAAAKRVVEHLLPDTRLWFPELRECAARALLHGLLMERIAVLVTSKDDPPCVLRLLKDHQRSW